MTHLLKRKINLHKEQFMRGIRKMIQMSTVAEIRRLYYIKGQGIRAIARGLLISRNTVKRALKEECIAPIYKPRQSINRPSIGGYEEKLASWLEADRLEPKRRQRTAKKLHKALQEQGYQGSYEAVAYYIRQWRRKEGKGLLSEVFVPLQFGPGLVFQFDWSEEEIELCGELVRIKAAHIRLCHSRYFLVIAYPNEQLEMVLDAHDKAFAHFGGTCQQGVYDNMRTAVNEILVGKEREYNARFLQMASHHLFKPVACTPAAGWEKGQVENQVGTSRKNFFTPLRRVNSLEELNAQLQQDCIDWAKTTAHPELKDKTVWEIYQAEREQLIPYRHAFDAYKVQAGVVNRCCLVQVETNQYSVDCRYVRQPITVHVYAHEIVIFWQNQEIGRHQRCFERHQRIFNPWHYVAVLDRKPGALRHGAPFQNWDLPAPLATMRQALNAYPDGDKHFVALLLLVQEHGLAVVTQACQQVINQNSCSVELVKQALKPPVLPHLVDDYPKATPMVEDCYCYDQTYLNKELAHAA